MKFNEGFIIIIAIIGTLVLLTITSTICRMSKRSKARRAHQERSSGFVLSEDKHLTIIASSLGHDSHYQYHGGLGWSWEDAHGFGHGHGADIHIGGVDGHGCGGDGGDGDGH